MATHTIPVTTTSVTSAGPRPYHKTLWTVQIVLALFFLVAAAGPKLVGQVYAVEIFDDIGIGQWFRYFVGAVELAGAIGLVVPRLAGLAAVGLVGVMVGAVITQLFVLGSVVLALSPLVLGVVFAAIAWARRDEVRRVVSDLRG